MKTLLFIGGPADAETIAVEDDREWIYIQEHPQEPVGLMSAANQSPPEKPDVFKQVMYKREKLREKDVTHEVMFYSEKGEGLIEALLSGYKNT